MMVMGQAAVPTILLRNYLTFCATKRNINETPRICDEIVITLQFAGFKGVKKIEMVIGRFTRNIARKLPAPLVPPSEENKESRVFS